MGNVSNDDRSLESTSTRAPGCPNKYRRPVAGPITSSRDVPTYSSGLNRAGAAGVAVPFEGLVWSAPGFAGAAGTLRLQQLMIDVLSFKIHRRNGRLPGHR